MYVFLPDKAATQHSLSRANAFKNGVIDFCIFG
jgi:hypothetical protein